MKTLACVLLLAAGLCFSVAAQEEAPLDELGIARKNLEVTIDKSRQALREAIDARIKDAASRGDFDAVQILRADKKNFEERNRLPQSPAMQASSLAYQESIQNATKRLEQAYTQTLKTLTMAMEFDKAELVKKEFDAFRRDPLKRPEIAKADVGPALPKGPFKYTFYEWKEGDKPVKMIHQDEGFCYLTAVGGPFDGGGESARISIGTDGHWYLSGSTGRGFLRLQAVAVQLNQPIAAPVDQPKPKTEAAEPKEQ